VVYGKNCSLCWQNTETVDHLFNECRMTLNVYRQVAFRFFRTSQFYSIANSDIKVQHIILDSKTDRVDSEIIAITMFIIWREKCNKIFREVAKTEIQLAEEVYNECKPLHWRKFNFVFVLFFKLFCNYICLKSLKANIVCLFVFKWPFLF
jgi:hypothetical protein